MKTRKPLQRKKRINPVSAKRRIEGAEYRKKRLEFLTDHPICEVWCAQNGWKWDTARWYSHFLGETQFYTELLALYDAPESTEVHHREKRGANYLKTETWLAVSNSAHRKIEDNKVWARKMGFLK